MQNQVNAQREQWKSLSNQRVDFSISEIWGNNITVWRAGEVEVCKMKQKLRNKKIIQGKRTIIPMLMKSTNKLSKICWATKNANADTNQRGI